MKTITIILAILFAAGLNSGRAQDNWTQKADVGGSGRGVATGFSIGDKGYIGTGENYSDTPVFKKDFWEYDPATNVWTQKADFGGIKRAYAFGFSIGSKGYIGTGANFHRDPIYFNDFWEYDPATNHWVKKADFAGGARDGAVGFSIGSKGYVGTGTNDYYKNDFWEYDPYTDAWTQKANVGGGVRNNATGFSIGNNGYIGTGTNGSYARMKDFWEYNPTANTWTQKADFGGEARRGAAGFSIGSKGYIGAGKNASSNNDNDFWEYDPLADSWTQKANFGGTGRDYPVGFSINNKGYMGTSYDPSHNVENDFWEYTPSCTVPTNLSVTNITSSSAKLTWDAVEGAEGYKIRYKVAGTNTWTRKKTYNNYKTIIGLALSTTYKWEVRTFCDFDQPYVMSEWSTAQQFTTSSLRSGEELAREFSLEIYPNPATDHATIQFALPQSSHVSVRVYDVNGKEILMLLNEELQSGEHSLQLNTSEFSKGVYFVKMTSDFGIETQKLMVQ